jgi:hypothetical protein
MSGGIRCMGQRRDRWQGVSAMAATPKHVLVGSVLGSRRKYRDTPGERHIPDGHELATVQVWVDVAALVWLKGAAAIGSKKSVSTLADGAVRLVAVDRRNEPEGGAA